jgi:hypothetical protein
MLRQDRRFRGGLRLDDDAPEVVMLISIWTDLRCVSVVGLLTRRLRAHDQYLVLDLIVSVDDCFESSSPLSFSFSFFPVLPCHVLSLRSFDPLRFDTPLYRPSLFQFPKHSPRDFNR